MSTKREMYITKKLTNLFPLSKDRTGHYPNGIHVRSVLLLKLKRSSLSPPKLVGGYMDFQQSQVERK